MVYERNAPSNAAFAHFVANPKIQSYSCTQCLRHDSKDTNHSLLTILKEFCVTRRYTSWKTIPYAISRNEG